MTAYLMIQNPGVAFAQSFTLLGASTKRGNSNGATIGKFGTGNKHGIAVLLRNELNPVVFASNLKLEFSTRAEVVNDGLKDTTFNRVVVQYGGKDSEGKNRSSTEDLGFVLEHGSDDWLGVDLALREFVPSQQRDPSRSDVQHAGQNDLAILEVEGGKGLHRFGSRDHAGIARAKIIRLGRAARRPNRSERKQEAQCQQRLESTRQGNVST